MLRVAGLLIPDETALLFLGDLSVQGVEVTLPNGALQRGASMRERLFNVSLMQRLCVRLAGLVLMCSIISVFRHVVGCSTRQLGSA